MGALMAHKIRVQEQYAIAWQDQINVLQSLAVKSAGLPLGSCIILDFSEPESYAISTFRIYEAWHRESISRCLFFPRSVVLLLSDINACLITENGKLLIFYNNRIISTDQNHVYLYKWDGNDVNQVLMSCE